MADYKAHYHARGDAPQEHIRRILLAVYPGRGQITRNPTRGSKHHRHGYVFQRVHGDLDLRYP